MPGDNILLVEDEAIIAMDIEMMLSERGYSVLGPFKSVTPAREAVAARSPGVAVLDVNLGQGETSLSLAIDLMGMGVPVIFLSGYGTEGMTLPENLRDAIRLSKPIRDGELVAAIEQACRSAA